MAGLGETVGALSRMNRPRMEGTGRLAEWNVTGDNPGRLKLFGFVAPGLPQRAPLVVALHGCTQNAGGYDSGSGWSTLATRHGFALILPEQDSANNASGCFNWFAPGDVTRGGGEVASIAGMIEQTVDAYGLDPARVYITGLSAGGAMAAAMLATYPELFAGGALLAGLPYGSAAGIAAAFEAMRGPRPRPAMEWGAIVRGASAYAGPRPPVQIWQGDADTTVRPGALAELAKQFCDVAGLSGEGVASVVDGAQHRLWAGRDGRPLVETFMVPGLGHGIPLKTGSADLDESIGHTGSYMLDAGISSTYRIARGWGLLTQASRPRSSAPASASDALGDLGSMLKSVLRAAGLKF